MKKGSENLTPNQQEYKHQLSRIRDALTRLKNQQYYNIPVELLPEEIQTREIPTRVTKADIKKLSDIKPRHLKELALNKDVPFEYREMVQEVLDLSTEEAQEQFWNDFDYSTSASKIVEPQINELPKPPKSSSFYYDELNNVLLDRETGEVVAEILPTQASEVILNLIENLTSSPNAEVADYILDTIRQKLSNEGTDKLAKDIVEYSEDVIDLSMEMHDYTTPEQLIETAVQLLDLIDPQHSFDHRSAIASRAYDDIKAMSTEMHSLNLVKSAHPHISNRRKKR